jgi:hypothetical protein
MPELKVSFESCPLFQVLLWVWIANPNAEDIVNKSSIERNILSPAREQGSFI